MEFKTAKNVTIPALGLGTWQMRGRECQQAVEMGLEIGYWHIDTAQMYRNERMVGNALQNADLPRDEIFLTTKIVQTNLRHDDVLRSFSESLKQLQSEYVDLLLIHWPNPSVPIPETIGAMNRLQEDGTVKHIGVSNFSVAQMQEASEASDTPILTNQVEYNPFVSQDAVHTACVERDMFLTAYTPIAKNRVSRDQTMQSIAEKYGKSPAQVTLRWHIQQDHVITIPKSSKRNHLEENFDVFDFELEKDEMQRISAIS